jgi:hypothetical protein
MAIMGKLDLRHVTARIVASAILAINVGSIAESLYLSRYAIYCGLGVGHLAALFYVPSLVLLMTTCFYRGGGALAKIRNVVFVLNALYIALLLIEGTCFSCVDTCVENLQQRQ